MKRLLVITVIICLVWCGGVVLKRQLDRIEVGMSAQDVLEVLGEPHNKGVEEVVDAGTLTVWEYKKVGVHVSLDEDVPIPEEKRAEIYYIHFLDDKVTGISKALRSAGE